MPASEGGSNRSLVAVHDKETKKCSLKNKKKKQPHCIFSTARFPGDYLKIYNFILPNAEYQMYLKVAQVTIATFCEEILAISS